MHLLVAQFFPDIYIPPQIFQYHIVVQNLLPYIANYVNNKYHIVEFYLFYKPFKKSHKQLLQL